MGLKVQDCVGTGVPEGETEVVWLQLLVRDLENDGDLLRVLLKLVDGV